MCEETIDRKVLVEVEFSCDDCDLTFYNEVIGLDVMNIDSGSGDISINGNIGCSVRQCPICGKTCKFTVHDIDTAGGENDDDEEEEDVPCKLIDELERLLRENKTPLPYYPNTPWEPKPWSEPMPYTPFYVGDPVLPNTICGSGGTVNNMHSQELSTPTDNRSTISVHPHEK